MWAVQIKFMQEWVTLASDFKTRDHAEWMVAKWKREMNCTGDSLFRTVENPLFEGDDVVPLVAEAASGEPITDELPALPKDVPECIHCKIFLDTPAELESGYCAECLAVIDKIAF